MIPHSSLTRLQTDAEQISYRREKACGDMTGLNIQAPNIAEAVGKTAICPEIQTVYTRTLRLTATITRYKPKGYCQGLFAPLDERGNLR